MTWYNLIYLGQVSRWRWHMDENVNFRIRPTVFSAQ